MTSRGSSRYVGLTSAQVAAAGREAVIAELGRRGLSGAREVRRSRRIFVEVPRPGTKEVLRLQVKTKRHGDWQSDTREG